VLHRLKGQHFLHRLFHASVRLLTDSKKNTEIKASLGILKTAVFIYLTNIFLMLNSKARHLSPYARTDAFLLTHFQWRRRNTAYYASRSSFSTVCSMDDLWWSMEERSYRRFEINYCRMAETLTNKQTPHSIKFKSSSTKIPEPQMSRRKTCVQYN